MLRSPNGSVAALVAAVVCACSLLGGTVALAQDRDPEAAMQAFDRGNAEYVAGDYVAAAHHFERANELNPTPVLLEYIADCYASAQMWDEAVAYYRAWAEADPSVAEDVERRTADITSLATASAYSLALRRVQMAVASANQAQPRPFDLWRQELDSPFNVVDVQIISQPPGATIYIDNIEFPLSVTTPYLGEVFEGPHFVRLELAHHDTIDGRIVVEPPARGQQIPVFSFTLVRQEAAVDLEVDPTTANVSYIGADGAIRTLGSGNWEGTLPAGPGAFVLQHAGGSRRIEVVIDEAEPNHFELALVDRPASTVAAAGIGTIIVVTSQRDVSVSVDGRTVGQGAGEFVVDVTEGSHAIEVSGDGYESWEQEVQVGADAEVRVYAAELQRGRRGGRR